MQIARYILPVVAGAITGIILIFAGEFVSHYLYPLPQGTDINNQESIIIAMKHMPAGAYRVLIANYAIASFLAGITASLIAKRNSVLPAVIVGTVLTLSGLYNIISLPHPLWFSVINLLVYLPMAYLGFYVVRKKAVFSVS